jgi:hypothetical protein
MCLSIGFIIVDILSVTPVLSVGLPDGINPFWKFAFIFKCFTDTIILDDFKTALDRLKQYKLQKLGGAGSSFHNGNCNDLERATWQGGMESAPWNESMGDAPVCKPKVNPIPNRIDHIDLEMNCWSKERGEISESGKG